MILMSPVWPIFALVGWPQVELPEEAVTVKLMPEFMSTAVLPPEVQVSDTSAAADQTISVVRTLSAVLLRHSATLASGIGAAEVNRKSVPLYTTSFIWPDAPRSPASKAAPAPFFTVLLPRLLALMVGAVTVLAPAEIQRS